MLQPVNKQIVVKLPKKAAVSAGGIHLPESSTTEDVMEGIVEVAAPDAVFAFKDGSPYHTVSTGDRVVFPKHTARQYRFGATEYLIVPSDQILAYIEHEST